MAIDFPLSSSSSSSASLLLTTNIHEVIRVIDIHWWATAEAEDIKCVMLAKGEVEISHMRPRLVCTAYERNVRAMHIAPSSRASMTTSPYPTSDQEETTKLLVFENFPPPPPPSLPYPPDFFLPTDAHPVSMTIQQRATIVPRIS